MSFPFYYLKVWGMSFSDKIFMTKIQRPQIFVCQKYFIAFRTTNKKNYFAGIYLFHTKNGRPGGQSDGIFLGPCLVCPMSVGFRMPGPRVLGVVLWCPEGSRGAMQWVSFGPMPGLSLLGVLFFHFMVSNKYQWQKRYICF